MKFYVFAACLAFSKAVPFSPKEPSCGYETCHPIDNTKINVHLIPHSHNDVGWLKTVDQYFYSLSNEIQLAGVQYIISSTVEALKTNPDRRFVQVETAFFWKWWKQASAREKQNYQNLVNTGQIEMINGAWSMNDEACVNYQSTIDQFTWGLRILNETLGSCGAPKIGWQIDPFGHSREQASIFKQLGFHGLFFSRLHYEDKLNRETNKEMDFLWQSSGNLNDSIIFSSALPNMYTSPDGFCWDFVCTGTIEAIVDDPESSSYNLAEMMESFLTIVKDYQKKYPTNNVIIPMGGDFYYQSAEMNYLNMDKLIKAFKDHKEINLIYSTPSCYLKAVNEAKPALKLKTDDFFPYAEEENSYWTGYFTSRPNSKRFERIGLNFLQATKQLASVLKFSGTEVEQGLMLLREAMGILQHHDAITGTEKEHVAKDYIRLLHQGIKTAERLASDSIISIIATKNNELDLTFKSCLLGNISVCNSQLFESFLVVVYNPLSRKQSHYVRLPIQDASYTVTAPDGAVIDSQILDPISNFAYVDKSVQPAPKEVVFEARHIMPFGLKVYFVSKTVKKTDEVAVPVSLKFGTKKLGFELDQKTNLLKSVTMNGKTVEIKQDFLYYPSVRSDGGQYSGAYVFRPESKAQRVSNTVTIKKQINRGLVLDEVQQVFSKWLTQIIRVYKAPNENYIEFDWLVGPIPEFRQIGQEIITRFTVSNLKNKAVFYTDSNGREMIQRTLNKRPDYSYNTDLDPISSNYFPVTSKITIKDDKLQVSVLNDRSQGGTSLAEGEIELMIHRRIFRDDGKGVGEALNEVEFGQGVVVRGQHFLVLGDPNNTNFKERDLALKKLLNPLVLVSRVGGTLSQIQAQINLKASVLTRALPDNVNILTFEPWKGDSYLLRLEHIMEKKEDQYLSQDVMLDLTDLFVNMRICDIRETTLGGNKWLDEFEAELQFEWITKDGIQAGNSKKGKQIDLKRISLSPMQIRTFVIQLEERIGHNGAGVFSPRTWLLILLALLLG